MAQDIIPAGSTYPMPAGSFYPVQPEEQSLGSKSTKNLFYIIFKWRRLILSIFVAFTVAAGIAMCFKPSVHTATAKILLKADRVPLQIAGLSFNNVKLPYPPEVVQSEVGLLMSREVLLPVAKKLLSRNGRPEKSIGAEEIEATRSSLATNLVPVVLPETNIIEVNYFARTPKDAENTLGMIVDQYMEQRAETYSGSNKVLKFYEQEKERVGVDLQAAEDNLKKQQEATRVVSVGEQITSQIQMLADREKALQLTEAETDATRAKVAQLKSQVSAHPERLVMSRERVSNPLVTKLKTDLVGAEVALQDLLQRYTEKDRRVQEKKEQVAVIKKELASAEKEGDIIGRETTALNPLREGLEKELAATQALLTSLASRRETVRAQVRETSGGLAALREKKVENDRLSRQVDLRKEAFLLYGKKLEEARIAAGLDKQQLSNVALIEQPYVAPSSDLKKRIGIVLLAAIVGLTLGMAIVFGIEFFNNSLRTQDDVEYYLALPVLATIPDLRGRPLALER